MWPMGTINNESTWLGLTNNLRCGLQCNNSNSIILGRAQYDRKPQDGPV